MDGLELRQVSKSYGDTQAVSRLSFEVARHEIVAILGPSGCGKSTALHLIAGLEQLDNGSIYWDGRDLAPIPPHRRQFGLMFQEFALFPHMDVGRNVAFGLKMKGMEPEASRQRVEEVLELVGLPGFGKRDVDELSGGERQRVALARSLAPEPELLMLDEPLGSLDRTLKERLMLELPQILRRTEQTALYVSHDQEEAFALADRIVVMRQGQVAQLGTPEAIYRQPNSAFVARFLGLDNLVQASAQGSRVDTPFGSMELSEPRHGEVTLLLRPEQASLSPLHGWQLEGEVVERSFRGGVQRVVLSMADGQQFSFDFPSAESLPPVGGNLTVYLPLPDGVQVLA